MAVVCYAKGFLSSIKNVADGVRRLEAAHAQLRSTEQADDAAVPPGLDNLASGLLSPTLLHSDSEETRLLTCCCLVDILRLYAPDAPYSPNQILVRVLSP